MPTGDYGFNFVQLGSMAPSTTEDNAHVGINDGIYGDIRMAQNMVLPRVNGSIDTTVGAVSMDVSDLNCAYAITV